MHYNNTYSSLRSCTFSYCEEDANMHKLTLYIIFSWLLLYISLGYILNTAWKGKKMTYIILELTICIELCVCECLYSHCSEYMNIVVLSCFVLNWVCQHKIFLFLFCIALQFFVQVVTVIVSSVIGCCNFSFVCFSEWH